MSGSVSIHQPSYWPWLGQLAKIAASETYVCLDSVAAAKNENQYRNRFYCAGEAKYLTLPVNYRMGLRIDQLEFTNNLWRDDHLNKLRNYYRKAPYFGEVFPKIAPLYEAPNQSPVQFILATMAFSFDALGINARVIRSSTLDVSGAKGDLVLDICRALGASRYVSGMGAYDYLQGSLDDFRAIGTEVTWHRYVHPQYGQDPNLPFVEGLACLDLFFFQGLMGAKQVFDSSLGQA